MYARDLMLWLHERLAAREALEHSQQRFERLRGYALIPRGRQNAGVRLSDEQIANALIGFAHPLPGFSGHASIVFGSLRPVGGAKASFMEKVCLRDVVAALVGEEEASSGLLRLTLSISRDFGGDNYSASLRLCEDEGTRVISFVSKNALSLFNPGAERDYDHDRLNEMSAVEKSFGSKLFRDLAHSVSISRYFNRPFKTDWREYESEEEQAEFHQKLGARRSSDFLNLRVDAQVTWPKEPTRIQFDGHWLVLFPKTNEYSHSISMDLRYERMSADDARSLMNRLLSVMSWCDDQPASLHEGWSGSPVPAPVPKLSLAFMTTHEWYFCRTSPDCEDLKKCLAFYRDGLNAFSVGLSSHSVLSFYRIIETKFGQSKWDVVKWINNYMDESDIPMMEEFKYYEVDRKNTGLSHGEYIYTWCRVATAHAAIDAPSDPDGAEETRRLLNAARIIKRLARHFIVLEFNFSDSYLTDNRK